MPDQYQHLKRDGYFAHTPTPDATQKYADSLTPEERANFRILSFGDEIHLGEVNYDDPAVNEKFRAWAKAKGLTLHEAMRQALGEWVNDR